MVADARLDEVPSPDIVVVPGGFGNRMLLEHEPLHDWIRSVHETSTWTTSVCTGSLLLAAAGLLDGAPATTHWLARDRLAELGAKPVPDRVVEHGKIVTAAGVSSGIDMALHLVRKINGERDRPGGPTRDRVRPAAAARRRRAGEGAAGGGRAGHGRLRRPGVGRRPRVRRLLG